MTDSESRPVAPSSQTVRRRVTALIGLSFAIGLLLLHANQFGEFFLHLTPLGSRDLFWWPMLAAILFYVRFVEGRPLRSIGLRRPTWMTLAVGVGFAVVAHWPLSWLSSAIVSGLHIPAGTSGAANAAIDQMPFWYRAILVTRAALVEEVLFRGYVIERVEQLTGSGVLAAVLSTALFAVAHLAYWGLAPLVFVAIAGLFSAVVYQWRRDLWANILGHWLTDALPILIFA